MVRQKFKEAEYFFYQLELNSFNHFLYESYLSAFINATRNISYAIQKEGSNKEGFKKWWLKQRLYMKNDKIMKFFYEIRNYSIKKGTNKLSENKGLTMRHLLEFDGKGNCNVTLKSRNGHSLLKKGSSSCKNFGLYICRRLILYLKRSVAIKFFCTI